MEEREGFVKNSKVAMFGVFNGILIPQILGEIFMLFISIFLINSVANSNPGATEEQIGQLAQSAYKSFPYASIINCVINIITLIIFIYIIKWDTIKSLFKKAINKKTIKQGIITALCIMGATILYNFFAIIVFNLDGSGNANQDDVIALIKQNEILGFFFVVLLGPIVEELTYRYCLFGEVAKKKKWVGYLVSGIVFMFMHAIASFIEAGGFNRELLMELVYLPPYLFSGIALCYAYDKTSNLGSSFIAHFLNNLISFLQIIFLY